MKAIQPYSPLVPHKVYAIVFKPISQNEEEYRLIVVEFDETREKRKIYYEAKIHKDYLYEVVNMVEKMIHKEARGNYQICVFDDDPANPYCQIAYQYL